MSGVKRRMATHAARLREVHRSSIDAQKEREVQSNLRIFRAALVRRGKSIKEIAELTRELEERVRGKSS